MGKYEQHQIPHFPLASIALALLAGGVSFGEAHYMHLCYLTVLISNFLLFTENYKNLHAKSSHITFTHPANIYLLNICCLPDTIPGLSHRTGEVDSGYAFNGTDQQ